MEKKAVIGGLFKMPFHQKLVNTGSLSVIIARRRPQLARPWWTPYPYSDALVVFDLLSLSSPSAS